MSRVEDKLDRIITLLSDSHSLRLLESPQHLSPQISSASASANVSGSSRQDAGALNLRPSMHVAVDNTASPRGLSFSESQAPIRVNCDEEGAMLNTFQTHMSFYFPFIILGSTSIATLRADRPFLFKAIILGASPRKAARQTSAGRRLLQSVSERYFLDGQTNLDLLQAILVYIGWQVSAYVPLAFLL